MIIAVIRCLGTFYADGTESMEIRISKAEATSLPNQDGKRVPVNLVIDDAVYEAGIRSTAENSYVWICPDLITRGGVRATLAHVLPSHGFRKNNRVGVSINGSMLHLKKVCTGSELNTPTRRRRTPEYDVRNTLKHSFELHAWIRESISIYGTLAKIVCEY